MAPDDELEPNLERCPEDAEHGPIDPDVDLRAPEQARERSAHRWTLPTIAVGGMLGASARHGLELAWPTEPESFPWATLITNVGGCALLGVLMVIVVEHGRGHPLLRPFAGTGVLGGFTTFSTYAVQSTVLVDAGRPGTALAYLFGTLLLALIGVVLGVGVGRALPRGRAA